MPISLQQREKSILPYLRTLSTPSTNSKLLYLHRTHIIRPRMEEAHQPPFQFKSLNSPHNEKNNAGTNAHSAWYTLFTISLLGRFPNLDDEEIILWATDLSNKMVKYIITLPEEERPSLDGTNVEQVMILGYYIPKKYFTSRAGQPEDILDRISRVIVACSRE